MNNSFVVEVKQSAISETTLTMDDIDAISNLSPVMNDFDERNIMEFTSRNDAESWISLMQNEQETVRDGSLQLRTINDQKVDAHMLFMPSWGTA